MAIDPVSIVTTVAQIIHLTQEALKVVEKLLEIKSPKTQNVTENINFDLASLKNQLRFGKTKIDTWNELWVIGNDKSERPFLKLWGEDGQTKILDLLTLILNESRSIDSHILPAKDRLDDQKTTLQKRNNPLKWSRKHSKAHSAKAEKPVDQTVNVGQLEDSVSRVIDYLSELWKDAESYYRQLHTPSVFADFVKVRSVPTALYEFLERQNCPLYLDLQFLDSRESAVGLSDFFEQKDACVSFHCIFQSHKSQIKAQHLVLKTAGLLASGEENDAEQEENVATEWLKLSKIKTRSCFSFRLPIENDSLKQTIVAESFPSNIFQEYQAEDSVFQSALLNRPPRTQPLTQRRKILIANQLAEATLVLLGSPWLNNFSSESIRYLCVDETRYHLCLYIDPKQSQSTEKSSQFQAIQQQQVFTLGLLLLEIALGTPVHQRWKDGEDPSSLWRDYQLLHRREVERKMGASYGRACEFCFFETIMEDSMPKGGLALTDDAGDDSLFDLEELIEGYHSEVFTRLRETMRRYGED